MNVRTEINKITRAVCLSLLGVWILGASITTANDIRDEIDRAVTRTADDPEARAALEEECIELATTVDDIPFADRYRAFRILEVIGTERCIEPLAALLGDFELSHAARNVLEKLPHEAVDRALLDALTTTSGSARLGVMGSLGARRTTPAVDPLIALLAHDDDAISAGAAAALGRIGTPAALASLRARLDGTVDRGRKLELYKAILHAAEMLVRDGRGDTALPAYESLMEADRPAHVRAGAFRGALAAQPSAAPDLAYRAILGEDRLFRREAIGVLSELDGGELVQRLVGDFEDFASEIKVVLLDIFAEWGDPVTLPVVNEALLDSAGDVRMAAIGAVNVLGDASSIEPLGRLLDETDDRSELRGAIESLRRIEEPDMNSKLVAYIEVASMSARPHIITVLAQRDAVEAVDAIMAQVEHEPMRVAAFRALNHLARPEHLPSMLKLLTELEGDTGRNEAINAVVSLSRRMAEISNPTIIRAVYGDLPDGPTVDATSEVAQMAREGRNRIPASNQIAGDPAPGIGKKLRVDYRINDEARSATGLEGEDVQLSAEERTVAVERIVEALDSASDAEAKVSLLGVLRGLGGQTAFDAAARYLYHEDERIHNGAVRALADWPDAYALEVLVDLSRNAPEPRHRTVALRGAVRLLRDMDPSSSETLSRYAALTTGDRSSGDLVFIFSGLAEVAHPAALRLLQSYLDDEDVREEALIAVRRIADTLDRDPETILAGVDDELPDVARFKPIFDGESLDGWRGDLALWWAEDGHIVGQTDEDNPLAHNSFLIRDEVESDFQLKFSYRIDTPWANSGVQVRSEEFEEYRVRGYQPDIATTDWITGICYEEGGRGILARRGQRVHLAGDGRTDTRRFAEERALGEHIHVHDWNEYQVIALGNRLTTYINGHLMHEVIDDTPSARDRGIIAFQLHTGNPMTIRFKEIKLKRLSEE